MKFINPDRPVSESEIQRCESRYKIRLPKSLRQIYLQFNGGEPDLYVFKNELLDTVVSEFLPLISEVRGTSIEAYKRLVLGRNIVPDNLFPFAVDGGGDYFFADMETARGGVHFYQSDALNRPPLLALEMSVDEFWSFLKSE